jgi:hypothetical protein
LTALAAVGRVQHARGTTVCLCISARRAADARIYRASRERYAAGAGAQLAVGQNVCMTDPPIDHDSLADLTGELRYLVTRWDPIGVYSEALDFPPDEYDLLIGPILTRLARGDSRAAFSEYLRNEIENHFGLDPVRSGSDAFADLFGRGMARRTPVHDVV